jgi:hypothetical protein
MSIFLQHILQKVLETKLMASLRAMEAREGISDDGVGWLLWPLSMVWMPSDMVSVVDR